MSQNQLDIKISVATQLDQLRAMETQFARQIVQLRALGQAGTAELGKVERNLGLVREQLSQISLASKTNAALGDTLKSIPVVGTAMNMLNGSAAAVGVALAAASYAANQFHASLQFADNLQDVSEQLGVSASSLQTLNAHFGDAGIKAPQVAQTLQKLQASLADAAAGSDPLIKAFGALGLSVTMLRGLAPDEAIARVGRSLAEHAGSAEAAAAAQAILGRGTGKLVNALKELGTQGLDTTKGAMTAAGRVIDDEMVKRLADANQKLEELDQRWTIFKASVVAGLLPGGAHGPQGREQNDRARAAAAKAPQVSLADQPLVPLHSEQEIARANAPRGRNQAAGTDTVPAAAMREENRRAEITNAPILAARAAAAAAAAAATEAAAAEQKRLDAARQITAELAKQAPEVAKALAAAGYELAGDEQKLGLLDAQAEAAQRRYDGQLAAALLAKDDVAANQAEQALSLDLLGIERARREVRKSIADAAEKERVEQEKLTVEERSALILRAETAAKQIELERQLAAANSSTDPVQKAAILASLTERLHTALAEVVRLRREEVALAASPIQKARAEADLASAEGRLAEAGKGTEPSTRKIETLRANDKEMTGLNALTAGEGVEAGALNTLQQIGSNGDIIARGVQTSFQGAFDGISSSMQGLINGTMTWGDALQNIASTIMQSVVTAISDMFAKWIVGRAAMALASIAWHKAETANVIADEASALPVKTAGAVASGISSWGLALVGGIAALALIASAGGFYEGGPVTGPGTGTSDSIPAWLSNGEYVMPAASTAKYRPILDQMRAGTLSTGMSAETTTLASGGGGGGAAGGGRGRAGSLTIVTAGTDSEVRRQLESAEGAALMLDIAQRGRLDLGIPG